jgi:putative ABC transport system permease protein
VAPAGADAGPAHGGGRGHDLGRRGGDQHADPPTGTYGTADALITLPGSDPHLAAEIATVRQRHGPVDVIENQAINTGTTQNVELRAQDPHGVFGQPLVALTDGRYPAGPGQVALTSQVATLYDVRVGGTWDEGGTAWRVTGTVENPTDLNDEFALVAPGQIAAPTQVTILLNGPASGRQQPFSGLPANAGVQLASQTRNSGVISPAIVVLAVTVLGMIFIGLVSVAGFTVMAQRRLRALGMLTALGAAGRNVRLVMVAGGAVIGLAAVVIGAVIGFGAWFAYVPSLETDTAHRIDPLNLPWWAIAIGMVLAVVTSMLAARRPALIVTRMPVVQALSGRPAAPRAVHRSGLRPGRHPGWPARGRRSRRLAAGRPPALWRLPPANRLRPARNRLDQVRPGRRAAGRHAHPVTEGLAVGTQVRHAGQGVAAGAAGCWI